MKLHKAAEREIEQAHAADFDFTYSVTHDKTARYPWQLALRYWTLDPITGHKVPTKVGLRWFPTQEQAQTACDSLNAQEQARLSLPSD